MPGQPITVIMPARNEARFVVAAVASVHAQTHPPVELIVVDDGSSDGTGALALDVPGPVPVRVLTQDRAKGSIAARNLGLAEATTEWIAMVDADDVWDPRKLQRQCEFLDAWTGPSPISVLGANGRHINVAGDDVGIYSPSVCATEAQFRRIVAGGGIPFIGHSTALFRRQDAIDAGLYWEDSLGAEDQDLFDRIASLRDGVILVVDEPLFQYRKKRGGMMQRLFWIQQVNFRRVVENRNRRRAGLAPLSLVEFEQQQRRRPLKVRAKERYRLYGQWLYRFGATNMVNGHPIVGGLQLLGAGLIRPRLVVDGVRRRFQAA